MPIDVYKVYICVDKCLCLSYPPEVFPVGLFGDIVFGVDFSLQGAKTSPLRNVFFAEHACYLEHRQNISLGLVHLPCFASHVQYYTAQLKRDTSPRNQKCVSFLWPIVVFLRLDC